MVYKKAYFGFRLELRLGVKDFSFDYMMEERSVWTENRVACLHTDILYCEPFLLEFDLFASRFWFCGL